MPLLEVSFELLCSSGQYVMKGYPIFQKKHPFAALQDFGMRTTSEIFNILANKKQMHNILWIIYWLFLYQNIQIDKILENATEKKRDESPDAR